MHCGRKPASPPPQVTPPPSPAATCWRCRPRSTHDDLAALQSACTGPAVALRRQLRELLAYHLGAVPLRTRQVMLDLQPLVDDR